MVSGKTTDTWNDTHTQMYLVVDSYVETLSTPTLTFLIRVPEHKFRLNVVFDVIHACAQ